MCHYRNSHTAANIILVTRTNDACIQREREGGEGEREGERQTDRERETERASPEQKLVLRWFLCCPTGADLGGLMTSAQLLAIHDLMDGVGVSLSLSLSPEQKSDAALESSPLVPALPATVPTIACRHVEEAFAASSLSVPDKERRRFEQIYARFVRSRRDQDTAFDPKGKQRVISV